MTLSTLSDLGSDLSWDNAGDVRYRRKPGHDRSLHQRRDPLETFETADFLARVIMHVPDPRRHLVRYCGWYLLKRMDFPE